MKNFLILIILISTFINNSFSQCNNFSVSLSEKDTKKLYDFSKNTEVTLHVSFNKNIYKKVYVEIYQAIGLRPVNMKKAEITDSAAIVIPVWYLGDSENQYLLIRISESQSISNQPLNSGYQCIDTIHILKGSVEKNKDAFWHKNIDVKYTVTIKDKQINNSVVTFKNKDLTVSETSLIFTGNGLSTNCDVKDQGKTYAFWIRAQVKSNTEILNVIIYPDAMKNLRKIFGIYRSDQITALSNVERKKILEKFPEYDKILDPSLKFASTNMYDTDHIVIYTMADESGIHFIGGDCIK